MKRHKTNFRIDQLMRGGAALLLLFAPAGLVAQDAPNGPALAPPQQTYEVSSDKAADLVTKAFGLSKTAKTQKDHSQVIELCGQALASKPSDRAAQYAQQLMSWAFNRRGEAAAAAGDEKNAIADFEASLQLDPKRWRALHNRGVSYYLAGQTEKALADFTETIRIEPRFPTAYFNRGELRIATDNFVGAVQDYSQAITLGSDDAQSYGGRAHALFRLGHYRLALADFDEALKQEPENATALAGRGDALAKTGQYREAATCFERAIQLDPGLGRAYESAAWLMATCPDDRFRQTKLSIETARKAIQLAGKTDDRNLDVLAAAYANDGQFERAKLIVTKAAAAAPKARLAVYQHRLRLYRQGKPYREARRLAAKPSSGKENKLRQR